MSRCREEWAVRIVEEKEGIIHKIIKRGLISIAIFLFSVVLGMVYEQDPKTFMTGFVIGSIMYKPYMGTSK